MAPPRLAISYCAGYLCGKARVSPPEDSRWRKLLIAATLVSLWLSPTCLCAHYAYILSQPRRRQFEGLRSAPQANFATPHTSPSHGVAVRQPKSKALIPHKARRDHHAIMVFFLKIWCPAQHRRAGPVRRAASSRAASAAACARCSRRRSSPLRRRVNRRNASRRTAEENNAQRKAYIGGCEVAARRGHSQDKSE